MRALFELLKSNRGIDVVPEYSFSSRKVAINDAFYTFTQQGLSKI